MSDESICFNPDLLAGYDDKAAAYQEAVDELTNGSLPDESDPCVSAESVPASFVISGMDPHSAKDVAEYVAHKPYYQTRAVLAKWWAPGSAWGDKPWPPEPAPVVSLGDWEKSPVDAIRKVAAIPNRSIGAATFAAILRNVPQTDRTLAAMEAYLGHDFYPLYPGADFSLIHEYRLANDRDLKSRLAVDLIERFEDRRSLYSEPDGLPDDSVALWREWTSELLPIFIDLHQKTTDRKLQERLAEALAGIDGNTGIDYLAGRVLENSDDESSALDALLSNALIRPEIAPHLARMLQAPSSQISNVHKEQIIEKVAEGRVAPDLGLASVIAQMLGRPGRWKNVSIDEHENRLVRYIAETGPKGIPLLVSLATGSGACPPHYLRIEAIRALAGMDSPKAAYELKTIIEGSGVYLGLPRDHAPMKEEAAEYIVAEGSPAAHRVAIEILTDPHVADREKEIILHEMAGYRWWRDNGRAAAFFLPALVALKDKNAVPFDSLKSTVGQLIQNQSASLSSIIEKYAEHEQVFIISAMFSNTALIDDENFFEKAFALLGNPRLSSTVKNILENEIIQLAKRSVESLAFATRFPPMLEKIFTSRGFSAESQTLLLGDIGRLPRGIQLLFRIADRPNLPPAVRKQALFSAALSPVSLFTTDTDIRDTEDEIVALYLRNNSAPLFLREAAVDALKERAKAMPDKRDHVRAILAACLPPPVEVQSRIKNALRE